jgi:hypothetical protein
MAIKIATNHGLATLRVSVGLDGEGPRALTELVSYAGGTPQTIGSWRLSTCDLGLPTRLQSDWPPTRELPERFLSGLQQALDAIELAPSIPLWLHLVKPYGLLGAIDWETALAPPLGRPLLRLPDFLERPRENRSTLDIALVCSEPVSEPRIDPRQLVVSVIGALLGPTPPRPRTKLHVFCDEQYFAPVSTLCAGHPHITVHSPQGARVHGIAERANLPMSAGSGEVRSPWLLWMRDSMKGRSLDAVHFACHGFLADQRPAIALAESPLSNRDRLDARYVGVGELAAFLTQCGAWSAVFSSPQQNYSEAGLRLLADTLAQTRPGPVLFHRMHAQGATSMGDLFRFLYAAVPSPVPQQGDWFAYCQPEIVASQEIQPKRWMSSAVSVLDANASLFEVPIPPLQPAPSWMDEPAGRPAPRESRGPSAGSASGDLYDLEAFSDDGVDFEREATAPSRSSEHSESRDFDDLFDLDAATPRASAAPSEPASSTSWVAAAQRYVENALQQKAQLEPRQGERGDASPASIAATEEFERTLQKLQAIVASAARPSGNSGKP